MGISTDGPSGCARMAPPRPFWYTPHTRLPAPTAPISMHPSRASSSHRELHRRRYSQLRYSQLHLVGSFAR
eukprot:1093707-Pyramimonas_sp.AAC.2